MPQQLNVLICGKIRDTESFSNDIGIYRSWREAGFVNRIVFSGWTSDRRDNPDMLLELCRKQVEIFLSEEPVLLTIGNSFHQAKSLHYGLSQFSDDDLVLKTRTDKVWLNLDLEYVTHLLRNSPPPSDKSPFKQRIIIQTALVFQPFFFNDIMFAGRAADLHKLVNFDLWYEAEHCVLNPEQIMHFSPFKDHSPYSRRFFRVNPGLQHQSAELAIRVQARMLDFPIYRRALYESLQALRTSYTISFHQINHTPPAPIDERWQGLNLSEILKMDIDRRVDGIKFQRGANSVECWSEERIDWLLRAPISTGCPDSLTDLCGTTPSPGEFFRIVADDQSYELARVLRTEFPDGVDLPVLPETGTTVVFPPRPPRVRV